MTTTTNAPSYLSDVAPELVDILAAPEDDTPRLIYADWLQDHGEPERAEFIRVQVELHGPRRQWEAIQREGCKACHNRKLALSRGAGGQMMPSACGRCDDLEYYVCSREERERRLFDHYKCEWFGESTAIHYLEREREDSEGQYPDLLKSIVRRGFVAEVHAPLSVLLEHLPALVREHPIERVRATDKEPERYAAVSDLWPNHWSWWSNNDNDPSSVQKQVWSLLDGFDPGYTSMDEECKNYPTAEAAHAALSVALLKLARG